MMLLLVKEGTFENISCNFALAQSSKTVLPILFGSVFIKVCMDQIVVFEDYSNGKQLFQIWL